jgi:hypothetical protein
MPPLTGYLGGLNRSVFIKWTPQPLRTMPLRSSCRSWSVS